MSWETLESILGRVAAPRTGWPGHDALAVLDEFCKLVEAKTGVKCQLVRGYLVNIGQEWKVMMAAATGGPEYVMLRAYIPATGDTVHLDLYAEELAEARNAEELRVRLEAFVSEPVTQENLRLLAG
ncbi:MAG: hypothetical protein FJX74_06950 [Armatimonadetes bacterium]|nr:hypothetical protein [Armatimonadota bacterium]